MKIITCLGKNSGMMFNNRRQSRDSKVIEDIFKIIGSATLYINDFSIELFTDKNLVECDDFLEKCPENDYCFVENVDFGKYLNKINAIIIYHWNRNYPFDKKFDTEILKNFRLKSSEDFIGTSHDKITREVFEKH